MSYHIEWDKNALKFLKKLEKNIASRILEKLEAVKENPFRYLKQYEGEDLYN